VGFRRTNLSPPWIDPQAQIGHIMSGGDRLGPHSSVRVLQVRHRCPAVDYSIGASRRVRRPAIAVDGGCLASLHHFLSKPSPPGSALRLQAARRAGGASTPPEAARCAALLDTRFVSGR
jgi:hypothetical protein